MLKQVIIIRTDLNMRRGKEIAQGAHASNKAVLQNLNDPRVIDWLNTAFTKIVVSVNSAQQLYQILQTARDKGVIAVDIIDNGTTEFNGVPTLTCGAIGPDQHQIIDQITGDLKLR